MSINFNAFKQPIIIRADQAERLAAPIGEIRLLADSDATGGAASTVHVRLLKGAPGARPHRHDQSAELFFIVGGSARILCGEAVQTVKKGDFVVVPPGVTHAFSAAPSSEAEILIVITPGVQRFDYFRKLIRILRGQETFEALAALQKKFDTHFVQSVVWGKL